MPGVLPTGARVLNDSSRVMPVLVTGIHVATRRVAGKTATSPSFERRDCFERKDCVTTWMAGTSPAMTTAVCVSTHIEADASFVLAMDFGLERAWEAINV
jgi:hypothetical protein